jgi:superfamily I DNA/RNA helicase
VVDLLNSLTDDQRAAAESVAAETVVSAGPGSGKTRLIAARIVHLIATGTDPRSILTLTFTRSACAEIRSRVVAALGFTVEPAIRTFHGFAASLVVAPGRRVATEAEAEAALRSLYEGPMRRPARGLMGIAALRGLLVEYEADPCAVLDQSYRFGHVQLVRSRLDYANLVPTWALVPDALLRRTRTVLERFGHVLVDEAQDATPAEERLVRAVAAEHEALSLFAVGDPRQAIFGWRGATGWSAKPPHHLTRTFRFGEAIADVANRQLADSPWPDVEGAADVLSEVEHAKHGPNVHDYTAALHDELGWGNPYREMSTLVLARTNRECEEIERLVGNGSARHVQRSAGGDPFAAERDRFALLWTEMPKLAVISTPHAAKGAEADRVVYVRDLARDEDNPEERRVDFVACTRARRRLVLLRGLA